LAKSVFQVHGVNEAGGEVTRKRLRRGQMLTFFAGLPPCLVGMEACATAHYWARANGAWPRGSPYATPICEDVKAYLKRDKNDAADAEAIREAVRRPSMRFVPVKTKEQRSALVMHRGRELLVRQRTMLANALRGHLAEFGLIAAQGLHNVAGLIAIVRNDERVPAGHGASGAAGDRRCDRQARHADCRLGGISKRGDSYLRRLLVNGAHAALLPPRPPRLILG
jgi:transposase